MTAVIDQRTLNRVPISSFMVGIIHSWEVEPGDMLKQVADIELPQMFAHYDFSNIYGTRACRGVDHRGAFNSELSV